MKSRIIRLGRKIRWVLIDDRGSLRVGWRLALGIAAYAAAFLAAFGGLSAIFGALFDAWGLTNTNLVYAPGWAQWVVAWHADIIYFAAYAVSAAAGAMLARRWTAPARGSVRTAIFAAICGLMMGAALTILALGLDSMRLERPLGEPWVSVLLIPAVLLLIVGQLSGEILSKRILFDPVKARFGRAAGYLAACVASVLLSGRRTSPMGLICALLMGIAGSAVYERGGIRASVALLAGWTAWTTVFFAWPNVSGTAVYQMYAVSDSWLTGGNGGALCGFAGMLAWGIFAAVLLRDELHRGLIWIMKGRGRDGKDSNCNRGTGLPRRKLLRTGAAGDEGSRGSGRAGRAQSRSPQGRR
ncbi:MAG: hypothetical protein ACI4MF_08850 [Candidatus Faecivicinus sp.]